MIGWNLPAVDSDILNSTVYVYASSTPVNAYSAGSETWTSVGQTTFAGKLTDPSGPVTLKTNASDIAGFSQTEGLSVWANLGTLTSGTYYYLVFVANDGGNAASGTYAIAGAQYVTTGQGGKITSPGFFDVEANSDPDYVGDFADLSWIAANHKSAPEPTVLALLALGFAGLALRRKVA
ncbi:MAG: PEP-CTERM sorting domain-containing protein [Lentisphaeraceae bacterium]|nr:PEP-CTERM sorting domain-containing protein [Lentisphaeraceae bacterium]